MRKELEGTKAELERTRAELERVKVDQLQDVWRGLWILSQAAVEKDLEEKVLERTSELQRQVNELQDSVNYKTWELKKKDDVLREKENEIRFLLDPPDRRVRRRQSN